MTLYNVIYHLKQMKQVRSLVFNSLCHNGNLMYCPVCKKQKARTFFQGPMYFRRSSESNVKSMSH